MDGAQHTQIANFIWQIADDAYAMSSSVAGTAT